MIRINNLEEERTQNILKNLGFFSREAQTKEGDKYNIWAKSIALDNYTSPLYAELLVNTSFYNDNCIRLFIDAGYNLEKDDYEEYELDCLSLDDELDFLMQMLNSGLSIEIIRKENK